MTQQYLHLSPTLKLPADIVTQKLAVLAQSGAGKSNAATVIIEEAVKLKVPVIVIDPKGDMWGVKSSADGKKPGIPATIFGGDHADLVLNPATGKMMGMKLAMRPITLAIFDVSEFDTRAQMHRFIADFCESFFKTKKRFKSPVLVDFEEVDEYVPQGINKVWGPDLPRCMHWVLTVQKKGRFLGIGTVGVSQRNADVSKSFLGQANVLIALRSAHPADKKPIEDYVKEHPDKKTVQQVTEQLPFLQDGEAFVLGFKIGIFEKIKFRMRETFDSGRTPKIGETAVEPQALAKADLKAWEEEMASFIEEAKQSDPEELKKQLRERDLKIRKLEAEKAKPIVETKTETKVEVRKVEVPVITDAQLNRLERIVEQMSGQESTLTVNMTKGLERLAAGRDTVAGILRTVAEKAGAKAQALAEQAAAVRMQIRPVAHASTTSQPAPPSSTPRSIANGQDSVQLPKGEGLVLTAVAQHPAGVTREQLTVLTGYKRSSRDAYLQRLREREFVDHDGDRIIATQAGVDALGPNYQPLPKGLDLRKYWLQRLPEGERKILGVILQHPNGVQRDALSELTQYKRSSRDAYIQRLSARELVDTRRDGTVAPSRTLFEDDEVVAQ